MAKCITRNKTGKSCKANALRNSRYCFMHDPAMEKERDEARKRGGFHKHAPSNPPKGIPAQIRQVQDVLPILDYSLSEALLLENSVQRDHLIATIASKYIDPIKIETIEARLLAIERALKLREKQK